MSKRRFVLLFVTLILWASLVAPAMAQEATTAASEAAPVTGAATLMLLTGLGAVIFVGLAAIFRENAKRKTQ